MSRVAGGAPHALDRKKPLDRLDLARHAVDVLVLEVGRERLRLEASAGRPRVLLPRGDPVDEPGQRRGLRAEEGAVARQPVVQRCRRQDVRAAKGGEAPRAQAHPVERKLDDRLGNRGIAVLRGHLRRVERLRVGKLLVRVADAVAPAVRDQLREDPALGVLDRGLGDAERRAGIETRLPEVDHCRPPALVRGRIGVHVTRIGGRIQLLDVDRL